ncbi:MAG: hypothetical protein P0Y56_01595 [Candidatus Andeanibacterium colombiense]|uniref:DUF8021 domain-containing protein n=1 Tax=Candidatus Andeanibacterium colombiense TaxID=3121345 RepID=A0AAJ6BPC9_9SPHN|nr:MAG: hypothetical protein P0Y56_01595 [Sphingomonadaceae bacterium]
MKRLTIAAISAFAALAFASPASAQAGCTREQLDTMAQSWVNALEAGDPFKMELGEWADYRENYKIGTLSGLFTKPRKVDFARKLLDTTTCQVMIETVMTDPEHPYVMATQMGSGFNGGIGQIQNIVTDEGDWLFSAANTLKYAKGENWGVIPEAQRNTRAELLAAANAYLDLFNDKSVQVPWGTPCARLEGGVYTGKGLPTDSCDVGVPSGIKMASRVYVVDETIGAVDVFLKMGDNARPDSHLFRIENGKIRYVHTVTNCGTQVNCGFPPFDPNKPMGPPQGN